jgi:hypothetical protein
MDQCDDCGEVACASCSTLLSCKFCGGGLCEECATACGRYVCTCVDCVSLVFVASIYSPLLALCSVPTLLAAALFCAAAMPNLPSTVIPAVSRIVSCVWRAAVRILVSAVDIDRPNEWSSWCTCA